MKFISLKNAVSFLVSVLLTGCTQNFSDTNATIKEALFGATDIEISADYLKKLPYASSYVRINNGPQIFMVLAFAETNPDTKQTQLKWLSSDNAMIVTENGRVVKTLNLPEFNLAHLSPKSSLFNFQQQHSEWQAIYDWQPNFDFDHRALISSQKIASQPLASALWNKTVDVWQEQIQFLHSNTHMTNQFWTDKRGQVMKSQQWLIPNKLYVEQEILKPYSE